MTETIVKRVILMMVILAGVVLLAATAQAGNKKQFCKTYASKATAQFHQSINLGCNFQGAYWHPARGLHKTWCMTQPRFVALDGNRKRGEMLNLCQAQGEN